MSRRYSDPVEVRVGVPQIGRQVLLPVGVEPDTVPTAFIWRGRLHIVRAVLEHWTQRLPWWRRPWAEESAEVNAPELEREVWRVEASTGRLMQTGVYDLTRDDRWRLVRVAD